MQVRQRGACSRADAGWAYRRLCPGGTRVAATAAVHAGDRTAARVPVWEKDEGGGGAGSAREREYWKSAGTCLRSFQRPADACFGGASGQRAPRPGLHCSPCPGSPVGTRCMEASGAHGPRGARPPSMLGISQGIVPRLRPRPDAAAQLHACSGAAGPHCVCACPCVLSVVEGPNRAEYERRRCVLCRMFGSQFVQKTTMLWGDDKKKVVKKGNEWVSCASWGAH